jgi:hypothetical protein
MNRHHTVLSGASADVDAGLSEEKTMGYRPNERTFFMARKTTSAPASASNMARLPEGFTALGSVTADGWVSLEEGNIVQGKLLGVFSRDDKRSKTGKSEFFQLETTVETQARYGRGQKAVVKTAPVGSTLNLNCGPKTSVLKDLLPDVRRGAEYLIYVRVGEKKDLNNGNTMWDMVVGSNMVRAPKAFVEPDFGGSDDGEADKADESSDAED